MLHGIPVFAAESSEMIEFDLKTNEMKTVEIEEQNSDSVDSYIPEGISTGIQTYGAIIDGDDRYRIPASLSSTTFPYCSYGVVSCTRLMEQVHLEQDGFWSERCGNSCACCI